MILGEPKGVRNAAESTIAAASAALLWAGEDALGVLSYAASRDARAMSRTRCAYEEATRSGDHSLDPLASFLYRADTFDAEAAALPEAVAPQWACRVRDALSRELMIQDVERPTDESGDWAPLLERSLVRSHAIWTVSLWCREDLPVDLIQFASRVAHFAATQLTPSF